MFRAFIALACIILISIVSLYFATADTMTPEIDREDLKVVRLSIKGANIYLVERSGKRLMIDSGNPGDEAGLRHWSLVPRITSSSPMDISIISAQPGTSRLDMA